VVTLIVQSAESNESAKLEPIFRTLNSEPATYGCREVQQQHTEGSTASDDCNDNHSTCTECAIIHDITNTKCFQFSWSFPICVA